MKIVTIAGVHHLVKTIIRDASGGGVILEKSMQIEGEDNVTSNAISSYLQKEALGTLPDFKLSGMVAMQERNTTAPEDVTIGYVTSQYELAKVMTEAITTNKVFRELLAERG